MTCRTGSEEINNSSDEIIAKAQSGDKEAFGQIFEQHHRFIYKFIYAMLGTHELAEELTQETFLGAYRGIVNLRGDAALKTWLCGIAKNLVYKSFRANCKNGEKNGEKIETLDLSVNQNEHPDALVLNKELNQVITSALGKLNEDKRLIFVLKEMQNLSYKEISDITGNAIPKLKTDLFRAKADMRSMLRVYMEAKK